MASEATKGSPTERLLRKRLAARLRQQRCRARKKELSLAKKHREQQEAKGSAHVPVQHTRRPVVVPIRGHGIGHGGVLSMTRTYGQPIHRHQPHKPHQPHQPHRPYQPHRTHPALHHQPHNYHNAHLPVRPIYMSEPPRMQSIGSVVSFEDNPACQRSNSFDSVPPSAYPNKPEPLYTTGLPQPVVIPTVSPTYSTKPTLEAEKFVQAPKVPSFPTDKKEETAIEAMLSLGSGIMST